MKILQYIILLATAAGIWYIAHNGLPNNSNQTGIGINVNVDVKQTVTPDIATLKIAANEIALTAGEAQQKTSTIIGSLTDLLEKAGVDKKDIQTSYFYVNPEYDYTTNPSGTLKGYRSSHELTIKIRNLTGANDLVGQIATITGAAVNSFTFDLENPEKGLDGIRAEAMKKLNEKASNIASAAGLTLGKITNLTEYVSPVGSPTPMMVAKADVQTVGNNANLQPGQIEVTLSVNATYAIK